MLAMQVTCTSYVTKYKVEPVLVATSIPLQKRLTFNSPSVYTLIHLFKATEMLTGLDRFHCTWKVRVTCGTRF